MTYRETLNKARENNIDVLDLSIACQCDNSFEFEYTEEEFEKLCARVREIYIKSDTLTKWAVAYAFNELIAEEKYSISDVLSMDKWELIDKASYYE